MICNKCGKYLADTARTCDNCGTFQDARQSWQAPGGSLQGMRQGREKARMTTLPPRPGSNPPRMYDDLNTYGASREPSQMRQGRSAPAAAPIQGSRPDMHRIGPMHQSPGSHHIRVRDQRRQPVKHSRINWALITLIACILAVAAFGGYLVYMNQSDEGHRITARKLVLEATPDQFELAVTKDPLRLEEQEDLLRDWTRIPVKAFWSVAEEYMDSGDLRTAITAFTISDILDPKNYDGLLEMASTYEMLTDTANAERIYLQLIGDVADFRTEAYTALIRIYQAQGRRPEAADMMKLAYEKTGRENYRLQREDYIPESPQVNLVAGRYDISVMKDQILITSPQGYDVYYTSDDEAVLPQDGVLAQEGVIEPEEGSIRIRAVCVSGDLVSDPLSVSYTFFYPTPPAPKANLAPNTYPSLRTVELRPGKLEDATKKEQAEMEANLVYHYTIDGSTPTENSPLYDGTPIKLPSGRVTLKAICINQYNKMSSTLEVGYKFEVKPYPLNMYGMKNNAVDFSDDSFGGFQLNLTTQHDFTSAYGQPKSETETTYLFTGQPAHQLEYDWGHAVFMQNNNLWQLVRVEMRSGFTSTPRGITLGKSEAEVVGAFKDFGQLPNVDGTRGLYYDFPRVGQVLADENGTRYIQYTAHTLESRMWVLQYWLDSSNHVKKIVHFYQP